ncbi:hypothetical protein XHC_1307 [Xanthomonas hortorum pv. carotae str. M081]|nr:hypothetical protein XHC_1307 [Xanthomonas hortorum pv. carotae str. M081]
MHFSVFFDQVCSCDLTPRLGSNSAPTTTTAAYILVEFILLQSEHFHFIKATFRWLSHCIF